jgi:LemA protein
MKKPNVLIEILKVFGMVILGWILWIFIFTITITPEGSETIEPFQGAGFLFGVLTAIAITFGIKYNQVHKIYQDIKGKFSNIQIFIERGDRLLEKANRVVEKYMNHEYDTFVEVSRTRSVPGKQGKRIKNSMQFQYEIENYPELKANDNVLKLLEQIRDCETAIANFKIEYNNEVANYNATIHSFPVVLFKKIARLKDVEFYQSASENDPDEMLGI